MENLVDVIIDNEISKKKPLFMKVENVTIIIDNEISKKKLLSMKVENVTYSRNYEQVIQELKERCNARRENFDVPQTREKFKRYVSECREAVLIIKVASGIKVFEAKKKCVPGFESYFH